VPVPTTRTVAAFSTVHAPPSNEPSNTVVPIAPPPPKEKGAEREGVRDGGPASTVVSGRGDVASPIALAASSSPVATLPSRLAVGVAPCRSSALTSDTGADGTADQSSAATPLTCGAAIEVPETEK